MNYKFKKGDKVKLARGVSIRKLGIDFSRKEAGLVSVLTIEDATPGSEAWGEKEQNGQPTYTINSWRIPESFLVGSP